MIFPGSIQAEPFSVKKQGRSSRGDPTLRYRKESRYRMT